MRSAFVSAGGCQTLKSEEWERQEQKLGLLACALDERNETDFHRELSRLPHRFARCALARSGRLLFDDLHRLLFADLMTFVTANL
jgi:hypothetical protein